VSGSLSGRRVGNLDPVFEGLMAKLVADEPRHRYTRIDQVPLLEDDELAAVIDHISENSSEDLEKLIDADMLHDWAVLLRARLLTPMVRNAAIGELARIRLQASARLWLVRYAHDECQAILEQMPDYDREQIKRGRAGGDL
jgi:hypothetical protein